jgi:hypothetical protein
LTDIRRVWLWFRTDRATYNPALSRFLGQLSHIYRSERDLLSSGDGVCTGEHTGLVEGASMFVAQREDLDSIANIEGCTITGRSKTARLARIPRLVEIIPSLGALQIARVKSRPKYPWMELWARLNREITPLCRHMFASRLSPTTESQREKVSGSCQVLDDDRRGT